MRNALQSGSNRNELVVRVQPDEAMYLKTNVKKVGESGITTAELDLTYKQRFGEAYIPEAYERLILDVFNNEHANFVRNDELEEVCPAALLNHETLDLFNTTERMVCCVCGNLVLGIVHSTAARDGRATTRAVHLQAGITWAPASGRDDSSSRI
eukprot:SAG31_NODE_264_length_18835_cov_7.543553_8_plen_154_part_00